MWGRRGLNDFKTASAFERFDVPRYFVPLTLKGNFALKLKLHYGLKERLPERWIIGAANLRAKWNQRKYARSISASGGMVNARDTAESEA